MFKRLRKALRLTPSTFRPASSAAMAEACEAKEARESQKVQQQNENCSGGSTGKECSSEKHVSFCETVKVKVRTPSPISPISPSCNLESGFIFPKPPDEQSHPISSSAILTRYYASSESTATSPETQCNPKSGIFKDKTLEQRMKMLYKSSLASQGIFTEPDSTDDQVENSDQGCCDRDDDGLSGDMVVGGACGGYDSDTN
ncbi:hypothetical protein OTUT144_0566 [Orientia tsutsugamushi str. UT144]|uniref:Uncharacterized protein n=1 Tax=Orientia tsutsugamushi str. UT144 TaxID=1441384 RepID=A0A0F3RMI8_ORITS|nr:hypothetical protein [Orientia tsutsugamushi]KJW07397.1 hypothetical protein OTUT144_0566 [Orientia tsutsugamushi str. UT144]